MTEKKRLKKLRRSKGKKKNINVQRSQRKHLEGKIANKRDVKEIFREAVENKSDG